MIKVHNPVDEMILSGVASADLKQGQLATMSVVNGEFTLAASNGSSQKNQTFVVYREPLGREFADDDPELDTIKKDSDLLFFNYSGAIVEDNQLDANSQTDFSTLTKGTKLVIGTSGFLTTAGAADAPASPIEYAEFLEYVNGVVIYRIL